MFACVCVCVMCQSEQLQALAKEIHVHKEYIHRRMRFVVDIRILVYVHIMHVCL